MKGGLYLQKLYRMGFVTCKSTLNYDNELVTIGSFTSAWSLLLRYKQVKLRIIPVSL